MAAPIANRNPVVTVLRIVLLPRTPAKLLANVRAFSRMLDQLKLNDRPEVTRVEPPKRRQGRCDAREIPGSSSGGRHDDGEESGEKIFAGRRAPPGEGMQRISASAAVLEVSDQAM